MAINFPTSPSLNAIHTESGLSWKYNGNAWLSVATSNTDSVVATGSTQPRSLSDRFADTVNVKDFGAVGDGTTDDTAAIQAAITASTGKILDFSSLTYVITNPLNLVGGCKLRNGTLNFTNSSCLRAVQSFSREDNLTSNSNLGSNIVTIADTSAYSVGNIIKIFSSNVWSNDGTDTVTSGEMTEVLEVTNGTTLKVVAALNDNYKTTDSAKVALVDSSITNIEISAMTLKGTSSTGTQNAIVISKTNNIKVSDCIITNSGNSGVYLLDVYNFTVTNNTLNNCANASQGYGVVSLGACRQGLVSDNTMTACRTGYTHGGTSGVGYNIVASGNTVLGCFTAGINSKSSSDGMVVSGNSVEGTNDSNGLGDGIRLRGRNAVITGNIITNCYRYSIYTPLYGAVDTTYSSVNVTGNLIVNARNIALYIQANDGNDVKGVVVSGNTINHIDDVSSSKGSIHVRCSSGSMNNIAITGNTVSNCPYNGLDVRTSGTGSIANYISSSNVIERNSNAISSGRAAIVTSGATNVDTATNITT